MRYWQHDETGRIVVSNTTADLSPQYYEISKEDYEAHKNALFPVDLEGAKMCRTEKLGLVLFILSAAGVIVVNVKGAELLLNVFLFISTIGSIMLFLFGDIE